MEKKVRRAQVTLPSAIWDILDVEMRGRIGERDAEIIRNIVISYLSDKGYFNKMEEIRGIPSSKRRELNE